MSKQILHKKLARLFLRLRKAAFSAPRERNNRQFSPPADRAQDRAILPWRKSRDSGVLFDPKQAASEVRKRKKIKTEKVVISGKMQSILEVKKRGNKGKKRR